jgi:hypothetical protein
MILAARMLPPSEAWHISIAGLSLRAFWIKGKFSMKSITREWVDKAEGDFAMLEREGRARKRRNHDGICFHAQPLAAE